MKNEKLKATILLLLSVIICFVVHNSIRISDLESSYDNENLSYQPSISNGLIKGEEGIMSVDSAQYDNDISTLQDLLDNSDAIVVGTIYSREQQGRSVNSDIKIEEVIKGDIEVNIISVFEPYYIREKDKQLISNNGCYMPMKYGDSYVLFLKKYSLGDDKTQYNLISDFYGMYPYKETLKVKDIDEDTILFKELENADFLAISTKKEREYVSQEEMSKEEVKKKLNIIEKYEEFRDEKYKNLHQEVINLVKEQRG